MASRGKSSGAARAARRPARVDGRTRARAPPPRAPARTFAWPRILAEHPHVSAGLLIGLVVLIYLWPVLLGGKVLSPVALLYAFSPWHAYLPAHVADYVNLTISDAVNAVYPWRVLARELIRQGTFPAWDPHVFAGTPFYTNPQTGIFSIFSLPLWILPLNWAIGFGAALKLWAGGFGTYLLVRQLRLGFLPGVLAGIVFAFSAINIVWLTHETLPAVAAMLPWMVWLVERIVARGGLGNAIGLAVATAIGLGGGHPGMQVHLVAVTALYVALRVSLLPDVDRRERLRLLGLAGGGLGLGALLMGAMLVPEALSSHGTLGTFARQNGAGSGELPGSHTSIHTLRSVLFPDWWGRSSGAEVPEEALHLGNVNYNERTYYAGVVALILAGIGIAARGDWRRKVPFLVVGLLGLAIPLHTPGLYALVTHLPVLDLVQNQRLYFAYGFAAAVLAAYGLQALIEGERRERGRLAVVSLALLIGVVTLSTVPLHAGDVSHFVRHLLHGTDYVSAGVLGLTSVAWFFVFAVGVAGAVLALRRRPERRTTIAAALVLLAACDGYHFAHGYQPMIPSSKLPSRTPAIAYLQRHASDGRFIGIEYALINDMSIAYGLDDVRGYDVPQPTLRFYRLWRAAEPDQTDWQPFEIHGLGPAVGRMISVLGARYVIADPGTARPTLGNRTLQPLRRVYAARDATIFLNPNAVPRALVAPRVRVTANEDATRAALLGEGFDPRTTVVAERDQPGGAGLAGAASGAGGRVRIAHEQNARVTLDATLARRGLVVLNDDFTDGWSVRVDGRPAQALHVNDVMRGVVVGPGHHEIVWSYAVPGLRAGVLLSLLALLALAGGGIALLARRRRG